MDFSLQKKKKQLNTPCNKIIFNNKIILEKFSFSNSIKTEKQGFKT